MKFINAGDLTFELLEKIMFLGKGLKKKKRKADSDEEDRPKKVQKKAANKQSTAEKKAAAKADMEFMTKTSMRLQYAVICTQVPSEANELELFKFFSYSGGRIRDVCILYVGDKSAGTAFVEFQEFNSLRKACGNTNPEFMGKSMIIRHALEVKEDYMNSAEYKDKEFISRRRIRVTNLLSVINESDMLGIFKPFGDIEAIDMHRKDGKKVCELTFKTESDARDALSSMQGVELAGQPLKLQLGDGSVSVHIGGHIAGEGGDVTVAPPAYLMSQPPPPPGLPGGPPQNVATKQEDEDPINLNDVLPVDIRIDSDFGATRRQGTAAEARVELMRKLAQRDIEQGRSNPNSRTIVLRNMFDTKEIDLVREPKYFEEIEEDLIGECKKFNGCLRIHLCQKACEIHLMFRDFIERQKAENVFQDRWFGGRKIQCLTVEDSIWNALPDAHVFQ